jgi:hypothetical protein
MCTNRRLADRNSAQPFLMWHNCFLRVPGKQKMLAFSYVWFVIPEVLKTKVNYKCCSLQNILLIFKHACFKSESIKIKIPAVLYDF